MPTAIKVTLYSEEDDAPQPQSIVFVAHITCLVRHANGEDFIATVVSGEKFWVEPGLAFDLLEGGSELGSW